MDKFSKLQFLQDLMLSCLSLWSWRFDSDFRLVECNSPESGNIGAILPEQSERIFVLAEDGQLPAVISLAAGIAWAVTSTGEKKGEKLFYALGPVRLYPDNLNTELVSDIADKFPVMSTYELSRYTSMLHKAVTGQTASVHLINDNTNDAGDSTAIQLLERLKEKIRNGELDYKEIVFEVLTNRCHLQALGAVTIEGAKNVALISIDKCCQAALESGLTRKTVSALCEEYVPQIRAASTGAEIARLSNTLMYHFVRLVRRLNGKVTYSEPVQACCTYIEKHAFDKITLELLARQVGYSPDHLSKKFKLEVGELPKDYILRTKIYHAQLMLTTTSMPLGERASKLSFCSNSHFTKVFRRFTQQTPASYRFMHNHMV